MQMTRYFRTRRPDGAIKVEELPLHRWLARHCVRMITSNRAIQLIHGFYLLSQAKPLPRDKQGHFPG